MKLITSFTTRRMLLSFVALLVCVCPPAFASDLTFSSGRSALAIPFEMEDNLIYVAVSINGSKPLSFILDTGAFTIVNLRHAQELGATLKLIGQSEGVGDEQQNMYVGSEKVAFSLPGMTLRRQRLLAVPLNKVEDCINEFVVDENGLDVSSSRPEAKTARRRVDGILGKEFFSNTVVEIDYASRLINVYEPRSYKYAGQGEKLPLELGTQHIFVKARIFTRGLESLTGRFMVDTGGAMALTLTKDFTERHQLLPPREQLTPFPICGLAGIMKEKSLFGTIEALQLGTLKVANPTVEFRQASVDYDFDGFIGGAVFRRYKLIFDYSRRLMVMEPAAGR